MIVFLHQLNSTKIQNFFKNADSDKYVYSGYGIEFDSRSEFLLPESSVGKSVIKFGVDRAYLSILIIKKKI